MSFFDPTGVGSGRRRPGIIAKHGWKTPSSDTNNYSEEGYERVIQPIKPLKLDSPATYSTACFNSGHQDPKQSGTEIGSGEGITQ